MRLRRLLVAAGIVAGVVMAQPGVASAHPLGNFTVNQASALTVAPDRVSIEHVIDMAEIPTFQARSDIDRNHDGTQSPRERASWASAECRQVVGGLHLRVDGARVALTVAQSQAVLLEGQAGLPTLRLECSLGARLATGAITHRIQLDNGYLSDRIGWREITAVGDGATLSGAHLRTVSPSALLTKYPTDRLLSPLDERSVQLSSRATGVVAHHSETPKHAAIPTVTGSVVRGFDGLTQSLTSSVSARRLTFGLALVALAFALGLGALHAFAPGHGKTVMAAYLVGERGSVKDGLLIGVTVALTHTMGVLLLGAILTASQTFAPESVYPYLSLASGICFAGLGVALFAGALRRRRSGVFRLGHHHHGPGGHTHDHPLEHHDAHEHDGHEHDAHEHHDDHAHAPADGATKVQPQLSRKNLLTLGFAGGLVPTPTAVVVLLGATAIGRAWFGAVLVVAYGIGMGATLVLAGLVLAKARRRFDLTGRSARAMRIAAFFPVATAAVITMSGLWLVARAAISF